MQLQGFLSSQLSNAEVRHLDALQEIVKIQIQSNFSITHPGYEPFELLPEVVERVQQLPANLQHKYLSLQLRNYIYGIYFKGNVAAAPTSNGIASSTLHQDVENNYGVASEAADFIGQLHASNSGEGYFDPDWEILRQESDGSLAVKKNNLTVHIKSVSHLLEKDRLASVGDTVSIRMPHNVIETQYYVAIGNAGLVDLHALERQLETIYIYFNFSFEGAVAVMRSLTEQLNSFEIPFSFKVLFDPDVYERYDAGILHCERNNFEVVRPILQDIYLKNRSYFHSSIPLFTKLLAPGLSLAEKPEKKVTFQEKFGMNRCQIVADGLLDAWYRDDNPKVRLNAITQRLNLQGIDLQQSYLNPNSQDIYAFLDLDK